MATSQQYEIQALQNGSSNPYVPTNSTLAYNEAECRAMPYTNYTNAPFSPSSYSSYPQVLSRSNRAVCPAIVLSFFSAFSSW